MRKILFLMAVALATLMSDRSQAVGAGLMCRSAHSKSPVLTATSEAQSKSSRQQNLSKFTDAMDLRAYDAIWEHTTNEMLKEVTQAQLSAEEVQQIKEAAQSVQDYMHDLVMSSFRWKKLNRIKEHAGVYKYRSRMEDLKEDLRVGNNAQVYGTPGYSISIYKALFHDIESSYLKLRSNLAEMDLLQKYGRSGGEIQKHTSLTTRMRDYFSEKFSSKEARKTRLEELRNENRKFFRVIGAGLEEYIAVRLYLENVVQGDPVLMADPAFTDKGRSGDQLASPKEIADYARNILSQLGVSGVEQVSPFVGQPKQRIPLDDIYSMYVRTPEIQIEQIKEDYMSNRGLFFRSNAVNNIFVNYMRKTIDLFPNQGKFRFVRHVLGVFTKFIERRHLELRYLPQIQDIVYAENDIGVQFAILRRQNDFSDLPDEFLITFARVSFYSKQWSDLRKYSEQVAQETGSQIDADFVEKMKNAEIEAIQAGTFSPGKADAKGTIIKDSYSLITTTLVLYNHDKIWHGIMSFMGVVTETAKFVCSTCGF